MEIGMGQLTFLTDGVDYACIWSPPDETYPSENSRALGLISTTLIKDAADYEAWQKEMTVRWLNACARILNRPREEMRVEKVITRNLN